MRLCAQWIDTKLGTMFAVADEKALYLLKFIDTRCHQQATERLRAKIHAEIVTGWTTPLRSIEKELKEYFEGTRKQFDTPIVTLGTPFQKQVWEELLKIPSGETSSYAEIAARVGKPTAYRAVANSNAVNQLALIIPCHRVINASGGIGGYGGTITRKRWLLEHEGVKSDRW